MRTTLVLGSFLPFVYYATKDNLFHFRGRKVSLTEHLLHLTIGVALVIVVTHAVLGNMTVMMIGLLFFAVAGALDEYIWHRGLPDVESDLHAKEHLALLIFIVVALVVDWLDGHAWRIPPDLLEHLRSAGRADDSGVVALAGTTANGLEWWRVAVLPVCLLPYAWFGLSDNVHHFRCRRVSSAERIVHLTIVLSLFTVVPHAVSGSRVVMTAALVLFLIARALDEWVFHRHLPGPEIDKHAKTHLAFLLFVVACLTVDWITNRGWV
jgi:phosphatidylglycerophosphate synthase